MKPDLMMKNVFYFHQGFLHFISGLQIKKSVIWVKLNIFLFYAKEMKRIPMQNTSVNCLFAFNVISVQRMKAK